MNAYVIVEVDIHDPESYEIYKQLTPASIAAFGGRFLVRGGQTEVVEGSRQPGRVVVLEFPSMDHARKWWDSEQYEKAKKIRQRAASTNMIIVEGCKK
jgi:uncharacterized protein (DUF1330 family)